MKRTRHYRALLALGCIPNIGNQRIRALIQHFKDASKIFNASLPELQQIKGFGFALARQIIKFDGWERVDRILERTVQCDARLVALGDSEYPLLLTQIFDPPPLLWVKGNPAILSVPGIAVIGTRNPDKAGLKQAERWSAALVRAGLIVNSGLAYGIDSAAHKTAVDTGGKTIAVLGSGIDWIYPPGNSKLAKRIIETGGAVITEFPPGSKPDAGNFPVRNRIVSGMSLGVLVIQSGLKGGSMITARSALDQNREVFVIPHTLDNSNGIGGNYLIKTGQGKLVQEIEDLLEEISYEPEPAAGVQPRQSVKISLSALAEEDRKICRVLESGPVHLDKLSESLGRSSHELFLQLLELEMAGLICQKAGKYFELQEHRV
ncbi:MAG: DNA-processing protein DprA [Balneolaceae bacterium]